LRLYIVALEVDAICPEETALLLKEVDGAALAFADGLIRSADGSLTFVPDFLLGEGPEEVKRGLRRSLRRLLDQSFDNLLFAHGMPLTGRGKEALGTFLKA
jgi:hypothetical protein